MINLYADNVDRDEGSFIVGWDFSKGEGHKRDTLIVMQGGKDGTMKIVNAFYNEDARDIFNRLTEKREYSNG